MIKVAFQTSVNEAYVLMSHKNSLRAHRSVERSFLVTAILNTTGISFPVNLDQAVIMPFETARKTFSTGKTVSAIMVRVEDPSIVEEVSRR